MKNWVVNQAVDDVVYRALYRAVYWDAVRVMKGLMYWDLHQAVNLAVNQTIFEAFYDAPFHPGLDFYLGSVA